MRKLLNNPWLVAAITVAATVLCALTLMDFGAQARVAADQFADLGERYLQDADDEDYKPKADQSLTAALAAIHMPATPFDPFAPRADAVSLSPEQTRPAEEQDPERETATLDAIWIQGDTALALINGRICEAGSTIGELHVQGIDTEGVWVTHPEGRDFLPLGASVTYTPARQIATHTTLASNEG